MAAKRARTENDEFNGWSESDCHEEIVALRARIKELEEEASAFESELKPWSDKELPRFVADTKRQLSPEEKDSTLKAFVLIVDQAKEHSSERTSHVINLFGKLKYGYQRDMFFYLHDAKKRSDERMDLTDKRINNVSKIEWIHLMLTICDATKFCFGEAGCCGSDLMGRRASIYLYSRDGKNYKNPAGRWICGLVYGFATLRGRHASHRCGNATCLHPNHLYPEVQENNFDRDLCHSGERSICTHVYAPCFSSLKLGTSGQTGTVTGELVGRKIADLVDFVRVSKTVVVFESRKYHWFAKGSYVYRCALSNYAKQVICPGKIRIKDDVLYIIAHHSLECPTLTQQKAEFDSKTRVVHLTADMFETRNVKPLNKDERVDKTFIKIEGRYYTQSSGRNDNPKSRICTSSSCSCRFRLESDDDNPYGKAIFIKNAKHSTKCDERYAKANKNNNQRDNEEKTLEPGKIEEVVIGKWSEVKIGDPFPWSNLIRALDHSLNTLPGENPDQYVALMRKAGQPVFGRIWNQEGKIAGNFGWCGKEHKFGPIQLLTEIDPLIREFEYNWKDFSEAAQFDKNGWHPIQINHLKGDISPAVLIIDGKEILGKVDIRNERASIGYNGGERVLDGAAVHSCKVLCRKAIFDLTG